ncbi:hypothetical protein ACIPJS_38190 [Streptomyces sp. NPDC086783]|uniref:hypothetical protein n=1 Tax=Streptomyces sp. NPDC086783 TaxID=3365758 RepID=UPI00382C3E86
MQTAVLDHADSEDPVELPMDVPGLELFRSTHPGRTFWCGMWLGGCGGRLTTRLCVDKICHFAHVPDPNALDSLCRRTSRTSGTGSADHLYIKKAVTGWMAHAGLRGETSILQDPTGDMRIGAQVTAEPSGHEPLRFVLDSAVLPAGEMPADSILGPGIEADPRILREQGYVHRVRCVPDGAHRKVQIGTEHSNGTFDWYDFVAGTVGLDPQGLSTPAVEEIRRLRTHTVPIGVHAHDLIAKKTSVAPSTPFVAVPVQPVDHTELVDALRTALANGVSVTRLQHSLDLLEAATRQGATAEENDLMRQASDELLRMRRGVGAQTPVPTPRARSRKPKRLPAPAPDRASASRTGNAAALQASREQRQPRRETFEREGLTPDGLRSAATAIRGALKKTAREQTTTTWATLKRQLGTALPRMTDAERVDVLIRVDQQTPKDEPLLSSLIAAGDPSLTSAYREIVAALGLDAPEGDDELRDVLEADVQQVHLHWSRS